MIEMRAEPTALPDIRGVELAAIPAEAVGEIVGRLRQASRDPRTVPVAAFQSSV